MDDGADGGNQLQRAARKEKEGFNIGAEGVVDVFVRNFFDRVVNLLKCCVVDQNIQATKTGHTLINHRFAGSPNSLVHLDGQGLNTALLDQTLGFLCILVFFQISKSNMSTLVRISHRNRPAYTTVTTGDDGYSTVQSVVALIRIFPMVCL